MKGQKIYHYIKFKLIKIQLLINFLFIVFVFNSINDSLTKIIKLSTIFPHLDSHKLLKIICKILLLVVKYKYDV